jgi:hypothetical protein
VAESDEPESRYVIGEDAREAIDMSEAEFERMIREMMNLSN